MLVPRSWYPLCRSSELPVGSVRSFEAFGTRLVAFRTRQGHLGVQLARCSHLGADLGRGVVSGEGLRCPLHGRCFGTDGHWIGGQPSCHQPSFHAQECYGLVFMFLSGEPDFPLPQPDGIAPDVLTRPRISTHPMSYELNCINAFDAAHLHSVHGRVVDDQPQCEQLSPYAMRISITASVAGQGWRDGLLRRLGHDQVQIETESWGGSVLIFHHRRVKTFTLHAALPLGAARTRTFTVSGRAAGGGRLSRARERLRLQLHHAAVLSFVRQDERALQGMEFHTTGLDDSDQILARWLQHFRAMPREQVD